MDIGPCAISFEGILRSRTESCYGEKTKNTSKDALN